MKKLAANIIYFFIFHLRIWKLFLSRYVRIHNAPVLAVFNYHRVIDKHRDSFIMEYEFGLLAQDFEKQIIWLKKHFKIINAAELDISLLKQDSKTPLALITFDDADSEFIEYAYPLLKKHNVSALMFVPTNFVGGEKAFFHLRFTNLCNKLQNQDWEKILQTEMPEEIKNKLLKFKDNFEDHVREIRQDVGLSFFRMKRAEVEALIDNWESLGSVKYDLGIKCMTWEQIIELKNQGIEFGAHSANHFQLARMDEDSIKKELIESKAVLEKYLKLEISTVSYPVGSYDTRVLKQAGLAGYKHGFTTREEIVTPRCLSERPLEIPRFSIGHSHINRIMHPFIKALIMNCGRRQKKTAAADDNYSHNTPNHKEQVGH